MNRLIQASIAISLVFGCATVNAAECKYETDTINPMTNEKVQWTKWSHFKLFNTANGYLAGVVDGDRKYLAIQLVINEWRPDRPSKEDLDSVMIVPAGAKLLVLMADESVVELHTESEVIGDSEFFMPHSWDNESDEYQVTTYTVVKYPLNEFALSALLAQGATDIRLEASEGERDYKFGDEPVDKIQTVLGCVQ